MRDARKRDAFFSWISSLTLMQEITALTGVILFLSAIAVGQSLWRAVFFIAAGIFGASGVISFWRANFSSKFVKPGQKLYQKNDTAHGMNQAIFLISNHQRIWERRLYGKACNTKHNAGRDKKQYGRTIFSQVENIRMGSKGIY